MSGGVVAAVAMLVLFPGFLGLKVFEAITDCRSRTEFDKLGVVVGFSLVVYMAYFGIALAFGLPHVPADYEAQSLSVNGWSVLVIAILAFAVPSVVGIVINKGWLSKFNYNNWIANRDVGGPASVWVGAFIDYSNKWVRVHLEDGSIVQGFVQWYSDDAEEHEVFLGEARIRSVNGEWKPVAGPGVLIVKGAPVTVVEFLDGEDSKA